MSTAEDVRRIALALPEAREEPHFDAVSFRVRRKIFATLRDEGKVLTLKLHPEDQANLVAGRPGVVRPVAGSWGRSGWTIVDHPAISDADLDELLHMAWACVAPKSLLAAARDTAAPGA